MSWYATILMIPEMRQNLIHMRCIFLLLLVITLLQFEEVALSHHSTYIFRLGVWKAENIRKLLRAYIMKWKITQWWSTLWTISTKRGITSNHWKQKPHRTLVSQVMAWDKHSLIICRSQTNNVQNAWYCIFQINFYFLKQSPLH